MSSEVCVKLGAKREEIVNSIDVLATSSASDAQLQALGRTEARLDDFVSAAKVDDGEAFMRQLAKIEDDIAKGKIKEIPFLDRPRLPKGVDPAYMERIAASAYLPRALRSMYQTIARHRVELPEERDEAMAVRVTQPIRGEYDPRAERIVRGVSTPVPRVEPLYLES